MSGSPLLGDIQRGSAVKVIMHENDYDDAASPIKPIELKGKVAPRRVTGAFAAPLRDSVRESFFDLAQRYQSLRDAARKTRAKKAVAAVTPPMRGERRLTDLPPAPVESDPPDPPEEPTLVQPLASRAPDPVPPASERRPTTVRPPPPPEPLPRMVMPSTMPPPMSLSASVPPPPAQPPNVWRPMLAAAALSATIGALVSGGFLALRGPSKPSPDSASVVAPPSTHEAANAAPCPVGAGTSTSSGTSTPTSDAIITTSSGGSSRSSGTSPSSPSSQNGPAPLQVSIDNLPIESAKGKLVESRASVLPANAFAHVAPVSINHFEAATPRKAPAVEAPAARPPSAAERAAERKRAKREAAAAAAAAHESKKASDDDDDDDDTDKAAAAPPPPPAPTKGPDRAAIAKAVGRAAGAATSCDSGPRQGRAVITFAPTGNVQSVQLVESFGDNSVNGCVLRALGRAHVPPFAGGPIEVRKGISW